MHNHERGDNVALITSGGSELGAAIAFQLLSSGTKVILCGRRGGFVKELEEQFPRQVFALRFDVTNSIDVARALANIDVPFANVDVLINNAGMDLDWTSKQRKQLTYLKRTLTNCQSLVRVARHVIPGMLNRGSGVVINIGWTQEEVLCHVSNTSYAAKVFIKQFIKDLNTDLVGSGVRLTGLDLSLCDNPQSYMVRFHCEEAQAAYANGSIACFSKNDIAKAVLSEATRLTLLTTAGFYDARPNWRGR